MYHLASAIPVDAGIGLMCGGTTLVGIAEPTEAKESKPKKMAKISCISGGDVYVCDLK
jgi:hypothetical protein